MASDAPFTMADAGERELVGTRLFDAPRERVWEAFTTPDLIKQWLLGPPGWSMPVCEMDVRSGGRYRYVWHHDEGKEKDFGMTGVNQEVLHLERIVHTERFEPEYYPGEAIITSEFEPEGDDKTVFTIRITCPSRDVRDGMRASGMESGMDTSYRRLNALLTASSK